MACLPCTLTLALRVMAWAGCSLSCAGNWYLRETAARVVLPTMRARIFYTAKDQSESESESRSRTNRGRADTKVRVYVKEEASDDKAEDGVAQVFKPGG